ncbi:MAG: hypothetical protein IKM09_01925 [Clostridia bacterium]|nr:hypothetical protein [Clostridia bacterium]
MKIFIFLLSVFLAFYSFSAGAFASEVSFTYIPEQSGAHDGLSNIDSILGDELSELHGVSDRLAEGKDADGGFMLSKVFSALKDELAGPLRLLFVLVGLIVLSGIFSSAAESVKSAGVSMAYSLCSALCFGMSVLLPVERLISRCGVFLEWVNNFLAALIPVFASVQAAGGALSSASFTSSGVFLLTAVMEQIFEKILLPLASVIFALSLASGLSKHDLGGVQKVLRDTFTTLIAFVMMINSAVYSFGNYIAVAKDGLGMRTVRFAAGSFIPVVGSAVGEAVRTVAGSLSLIRSGVGWVCCAALITMLAPPLISALLYRTAIELAAALARIVSLGGEARLLDGAVAVCNLVCALIAASSVLFLLAVTLFVKTAVSV